MSTETSGLENEKTIQNYAERDGDSPIASADIGENAFEVFKITNEGVDFRTVGWIRASIIFLKSNICPIVTLAFSLSDMVVIL
jgi:hypothetical protein